MNGHLRMALATTDTLHHRHFARYVDSQVPGVTLQGIFLETKEYPWKQKAKAHTVDCFPNLWRGLALNPYFRSSREHRLQEKYEREHFFPDGSTDWPSASMYSFTSLNEMSAVSTIENLGPELLFVYGTGILRGPILDVASLAINAHGGRLPRYRGLDTNLWAACEGRSEDMAVTLHRLDAKVDSGPIYLMEPIPPAPDLSVISLRYHTTILCEQMFGKLVDELISGESDPTPQLGASSYYNPMPALLKRRADKALRRFVADSVAP